MDRKFVSDGKDVKNMVMLLWDDDIEVILIVFGWEFDEDEFNFIILYVDNVILVYVVNKMNKIVMEIMDKMRKGML